MVREGRRPTGSSGSSGQERKACECNVVEHNHANFKLTPFGIKMLCVSEDCFETVRAHFIANKGEFDTHEKQSGVPTALEPTKSRTACPKRADFIHRRQQASKTIPSVRKVEKQSKAVPKFTPTKFPPLPGAVPDRKSKDRPRPAGSSGSRDGGVTEEVLFGSVELWCIFSEYIARFKTCKTRLEQVIRVSYMISKYGV